MPFSVHGFCGNDIRYCFDRDGISEVRCLGHAEYGPKTVYFGPMGCRTGFYLLLSGTYESADILPLIRGMFEFIRDYEGEVPGAAAKDCGNYLDMNLPMFICGTPVK